MFMQTTTSRSLRWNTGRNCHRPGKRIRQAPAAVIYSDAHARVTPTTFSAATMQHACLRFPSALQIDIFDVLCFHQKQLLLRVFVGFCGPVKSTPQHQSKPIYRQGCQAEVQAAGFADHALNGIRFNRLSGSRSLSGRCRPLTELCALHSSCVLSPLQSRTHQGCAALLCFAGAAVQETNSTRSRKVWKLRQLDLNVSSMLLSCSSYKQNISATAVMPCNSPCLNRFVLLVIILCT